eukprot:TRINITY_DN3428_c0_g1_i1.p1 TRINITY_DN3428_c0_g1~~TRINITY_DN3428_c0_g1_i1.p1  ORF type:complete len:459 (-),score=102.91 TRINITY_DN3428_c0_g1_i1:407-1708(-)
MPVGVVALFVAFLGVAVAEKRAELSISPPYTHLDSTGHRTLEHFSVGGDAIVHKDFIRLTTDRQSKRGWIWSSGALNLETWSVVMEFRISGKGRTLFGDGVGLWLTDHSSRVDGPIHGFTSSFVGFGIIFDTFRNTDVSIPHKDIAIIWNDGTMSEDQVRNTQVGCDVKNLRYHESRADFTPFNSSRARISWAHHQLTVDIDPASDGNWQQCAVLLDHHVPAGAMSQAYVGALATTGQLADNHDVLALGVYDSVDEATQVCAVAPRRPEGLDRAMAELEHRLTGIIEAVQNTVGKLRKQEDEAEGRIQILEEKAETAATTALERRLADVEQRIRGIIDSHVTDRLGALEAKVDEKVTSSVVSRVAHLERQVDQSLDTRLRNIEAVMETFVRKEVSRSGAGNWKVPFIVLVCILLVFFAWSMKNYMWIKRMHTL